MELYMAHAPLLIYMLADHLDAVLATGEDIMARGSQWRKLADKPGEPAGFVMRQRKIADEIRGLELMLVAHILKGRNHALTLAECDSRFRVIGKLFAFGTVTLLDAVEESGDARSMDFDTGDEIIAYVRSRGLIASSAAATCMSLDLTIDDSFLVAKRMPIGPLLNMAAAFLDALNVQYDLFVEEKPVAKKALLLDLDESEHAPLS